MTQHCSSMLFVPAWVPRLPLKAVCVHHYAVHRTKRDRSYPPLIFPSPSLCCFLNPVRLFVTPFLASPASAPLHKTLSCVDAESGWYTPMTQNSTQRQPRSNWVAASILMENCGWLMGDFFIVTSSAPYSTFCSLSTCSPHNHYPLLSPLHYCHVRFDLK